MKSLFLLLPTLALVACSRDATSYPSLAKRSVEAVDFAEPAPPPAAVPAADTALDARITGFRDRLRTVTAGFDAAIERARRAAAVRGATTAGSEAWLDAQTGLAALDDWRAQATALAGDVDGAARDRAAALAPPYPALDALQTAVAQELTRQDSATTEVAAQLPAA